MPSSRWFWFLFLTSIPLSVLNGLLFFLPPWQVYATDRYHLLWMLLLVLGAGGGFLAGWSRSLISWRMEKPCAAGLIAFAVFGAISSLLASLPRYAFLEWAYFMGAAMFGMGVYRAVQGRGTSAVMGALYQVVFLAVYVYSLFYLLWYFSQISCEKLFCARFVLPWYDNPRTFDTLFLPLLLLYPLTIRYLPERLSVRIAYWLLGAVWFSLLFVSGGRTNWLVVFLVCMFLYGVAGSQLLPWLKRFVLFMLFGFVVYLLLHGAWPLLQGSGAEMEPSRSFDSLSSLHARLELWHRAWRIFLEYPWLGSGPMHFALYGDVPHMGEGAHPHSLILQLLAEWGGICTTLFVTNVLLLFIKAISFFRRQTKPQETESLSCLALFAAWLAMLLAAQASSTNMLMLAGFSGILAGIVNHGNEATSTTGGVADRILQVSLSAAIVAVLLRSIYPEAACRMEEATAYLQAYPDDKQVSPRFWSQGKIAFTHQYLPQCYRDAEQLFAGGAPSERMQQQRSVR